MASPSRRPNPLRTTKSFTKIESNDPLASPRPKRAATMQNGALPKLVTSNKETGPQKIAEEPESADAFENKQGDETPVEPQPRGSVDLDDLPIELIGLTDNFIESLSTRSRPAPPTIDNISQLFQDFYYTAAQHINTHISALISKHRRETSPAPSASSRTSTASLLRAKAASIGKDRQKAGTPKADAPEQQMITADEMTERKRKRKAIEQQRGTLEEAVERRLCEGIYAKIYRHRTTQDEAQDDKLRSKTAALAVVGIGLTDLGVQLTESSEPPEAQAERAEEVRKWLDGARQELIAMNESRYPLGKLNHLKTAHKSIVDTLSHFHPSSSADEIMPMLIYTLITLPPANLNVISDLRFIERFRWEPKLVGEAAYCMTNLEAAISFLETVDLSTLRSDEAPSGPPRSSSPPRAETFPPAYSPTLSAATSTTAASDANPAGTVRKPSPSPANRLKVAQERNRRFSDLVNTPAQALGAASDAVRNTADQGLKNISNSLGDSYRMLMGRLREPANADAEVVVPKTLEDARKLIGTPPLEDDASVTSSQNQEDNSANLTESGARRPRPREDKVLNLISGRTKSSAARDHSADSSRSGESGTKRLSGLFGGDDGALGRENRTSGGGVTTPNPLTEGMRNLSNSLNPMAKFASGVGMGIGSFRPFARTPSQPVTPQATTISGSVKSGSSGAEGGDLATVRLTLGTHTHTPTPPLQHLAFPELAANLPPKETPKINPPIKRFMEMQNPADLRIAEVLELLRDYRRLAGALKEMDAFKE
ncbi:hypothetical protein M406DRAFT_245698 [Cryphonectria parasitica EP155]|uniref:VPS9 domain-containing protein n=1 Tax=Cryphonectria parasitica (strain ATCC 38755 / EP155) TaxID=660469 RepID=A0A9P4YBL0_CRYP1|nr:uncharacterized protein M406DRAFT_245698 [Cryphonectria parasitica EP155]KAF3770467.1 hypothetical protein M406DRAFT_245698 [Cryphonectria parasitica EP155]